MTTGAHRCVMRDSATGREVFDRPVFGRALRVDSEVETPDWGRVRVVRVEGGIAFVVATGPKPERSKVVVGRSRGGKGVG